LHLIVACPEGFEPKADFVSRAKAQGADVQVVRDPVVAASNADVISTDVFASMGQEAEQAKRLQAFTGMCVSQRLVDRANPNVMVLHCLPAHRG
jgi:ornithine carbamoyltransferase